MRQGVVEQTGSSAHSQPFASDAEVSRYQANMAVSVCKIACGLVGSWGLMGAREARSNLPCTVG